MLQAWAVQPVCDPVLEQLVHQLHVEHVRPTQHVVQAARVRQGGVAPASMHALMCIVVCTWPVRLAILTALCAGLEPVVSMLCEGGVHCEVQEVEYSGHGGEGQGQADVDRGGTDGVACNDVAGGDVPRPWHVWWG